MAVLPLVAGRSTRVANKSGRPIRLDELVHTVFRSNTCLLSRVPDGATTVNPRFSNLGGFCVGERSLTAPTRHSSRSPDARLRLCPPRTRRTVSSHTSHDKLRLIPGYNARPRGLFRRIL